MIFFFENLKIPATVQVYRLNFVAQKNLKVLCDYEILLPGITIQPVVIIARFSDLFVIMNPLL